MLLSEGSSSGLFREDAYVRDCARLEMRTGDREKKKMNWGFILEEKERRAVAYGQAPKTFQT